MVCYEQLIEILLGFNYAHENTRPGYITLASVIGKYCWIQMTQGVQRDLNRLQMDCSGCVNCKAVEVFLNELCPIATLEIFSKLNFTSYQI